MSFSDLLALRDKVEKVIAKRVASERKHLEGKLAELAGFDGDEIAKRRGRPPNSANAKVGKRAKAKIKYRGPKGEMWSGRGMTPRWAYIKAGKKKESFLAK